MGENCLPHNKKKSVVQNKIRKYAVDIAMLWLGKRKAQMSKQAKTLTAQELRRVLDYIATRPHAARNRAMLLTTHYAGLRVSEVATLRYSDLVDGEGRIQSEFRLRAAETKNGEARTVFVSERLRKEIFAYVTATEFASNDSRLFYTQKSNGFSANTLTQFFHHLYKRAGIAGASSHSGRRTFITTLAERGVSARVLMTLAGHKNLSTTQCYIDVRDDMMRNAVELV